MRAMTQMLFEWFATRDFWGWAGFSLAGNAVIFAASVLACGWLAEHYAQRSLFEAPRPVSRGDVLLSALTVVLNSGVAVAGWWLWKAGWITLTQPPWWRTVLDVLVFLFLMDLGMYLFHRLAHHPWIYPWVHATHHRHEATNVLSLFVLNPFEVLGFGGLMIVVMMLVPFSAIAVLVYLVLNIAFGTLGHAGVEPFPRSWARWLLVRQVGTSTFHAGHHVLPVTNYGFYTVVWDRLFGTLHPRYDEALQGTAGLR